MELGGDEKRIQALFSDLAVEDQSRVPHFGRLWTRAQTSALRRAVAPLREKSFIKPIAVLASCFVTAVACTLVIWAWSRSTPSPIPGIVNSQPQPQNTAGALAITQPVKVVAISESKKVRRRKRSFDRRIATDAALLSSWQSPTQQFMQSPTALVLSSPPPLNQSVKDLESFLSKNSEIMKESNR